MVLEISKGNRGEDKDKKPFPPMGCIEDGNSYRFSRSHELDTLMPREIRETKY